MKTSTIRARSVIATTLWIVMGVCLLARSGDAGVTQEVIRGAQAVSPVVPLKTTMHLDGLPIVEAWRPGEPTADLDKTNRLNPHKQDAAAQAQARRETATVDPLLSSVTRAAGTAVTRTFPVPLLNVDGQGYSGVNPPGTSGDVGQNYYIQAINSDSTLVTVYNKLDGTVAAGPFLLESLWPGAGDCTNGRGDPIVLYDALADRWLLSEISNFNDRLCVYISQTGDPVNGGWFAYQFPAPGFPDYPKYGVWPDAYYVGTNESSPAVYAIDRPAMLAGIPAGMLRVGVTELEGFGFQMLQPADVDGPAAPPAGAPGIFMRHRDDETHNPATSDPAADFLEIFEFAVDFAAPANTTFTGPIVVPIAEIDSELCGFFTFDCFEQPGTTVDLDPVREVVMWRLVYRNFGSHEMLLGNLVTDVDGNDRGGIRWFELRKATPGSPWTLFQQGTHSPDTDNRFMGSIAMDGAGNIALGYNVSSSSQFPSLRYAGRLADDPAGTLPQGEYSLVEGLASNQSNRYGDYSSMSVDPVDDCTFWFTGEWNAAPTWSTRIASFRFDGCGEPGFVLTANPPNPQVCAPGPVDAIEINVASVSDFTGDVTLSLDLPVGFETTGLTPNPVSAPGAATLALETTGAVTVGVNDIIVSGSASGASDNQTTIAVVVTDAVPAAPLPLSPADGATDLALEPELSWTFTDSTLYEVQVATDPAFQSVVAEASLAGTTFVPTGLATDTTYFWRVRGSNVCGEGSYSPTVSFTTGLTICSTEQLVLPDNNSAGVLQDLTVSETGIIEDLDVSLRVTHSWVGDLFFILANLDTGASVVLMDRPGVPDDDFGCDAEDVNAVFDDEGDYVVETACIEPGPGPEAIAGRPIPDEALAVFDGQELAGEWRLFASDNAGSDLGAVDEWCLLPTVTTGPDSDGDGVGDDIDNCTDFPNSGQYDSNGDGIGNACDGDVVGPGGGPEDCFVNFPDLDVLKAAFFTSSGDANYNADTDFNGDLAVNFTDLNRMREFFFAPPGPSATGCN